MGFNERKQFYTKIEEKRERPLISFITSFRNNAGASIASDVIPELLRLVDKIPRDTKNLDLLSLMLYDERAKFICSRRLVLQLKRK